MLVGCGGGSAVDAPVTLDADPAAADAANPSGPDAAPLPPDATPYVPDPIPVLDDEPPAPCADPGAGFQFLDDACGVKRHPALQDRDRACPTFDETVPDGYAPTSAPVVVDADLVGLVPDALDVTVILIRRVGEGRVPHVRYVSNGWHDYAFQPWSTSKFLAAANAAAGLRAASGGTVGLTASADGVALGDLVTSMHNYDWAMYSSNAIGRYFHDIGGRAEANALIHEAWLGRPAEETFGGNYGTPSPGLGYTFVEPGGASVTITPDTSSGYWNHLSTFTLAEALKRLVLHREDPARALPGADWADVGVLLYGAEDPAMYGAWGGMSADKAIYLQSAHDLDYLDARSNGQWTIFSKLGNGSGGELLDVAYGCFPVLDPDGDPVPGWGREVVIAAHLPTTGATWAERDRLLARYFRMILIRVIDGRIP